jgi:cellulose synthase operon protein C
MPVDDPSIFPLEQRPDCPGPELMAAYIDGRRLWWGGRRRLEKHFADCDRCFTLLRDIMDFRDSEAGQELPDTAPDASRSRFVAIPAGPVLVSRRPPRFAWLGVGGLGAVAAALLVIFVMRGPGGGPRLDPLIDAIGTQRVTDARIVGFEYGPRPEVLRSTEPSDSVPSISLDARGAAARIQEEAGTSTDATARHAAGVSRLISGDIDTAINDLQAAVTADPTKATFLNDLAAALLTRGIRHQNPQDLTEALHRLDDVIAKDPRHADAMFNRALALESLGQKDAARAAWESYLQVDARSPWADEARQHLASTR